MAEAFTYNEVSSAMGSLGNKAVGVDALKDTIIKKASVDEQIVQNITNEFNKWQAAGKMPYYTTTARVIPISKKTSAFPPVGEIRTISITPAITKLFEKILYNKITREVDEKKLLTEE